MAFFILLVLSYGPLNWSLPWWMWVISVLHGLFSDEVSVTIKEKK